MKLAFLIFENFRKDTSKSTGIGRYCKQIGDEVEKAVRAKLGGVIEKKTNYKFSCRQLYDKISYS